MKFYFIIPLLCLLQYSVQAQCDRETAVNDYNTNYLGSAFDIAEIAWTGDLASCTAGSVSSIVNDKILQRVNYFRRLSKLNDDCLLNTTWNAHCQEAALMQEANTLSHCTGTNGAPCDAWTCSSSNAITASQQSNLAWGNWNFFNPITNYMEDSGGGNEPVGHRRWILFSRGKTFASGITPNRQALWAFGNFANPAGNTLDYIAYPPGDYTPAELVFPRWSFGIPNADFTNASVTMTDQSGNPISLNVIFNANIAYGDYSIVWEPTGINTTSVEDVTYNVTISNIGGPVPQSSYSYTVTIIQPTHPPACPTGEVWSATNCACEVENTIPPSLIITDSNMDGTYMACNDIITAMDVNSVSDAFLISAGSILLEPGFEVALGGVLLAEIDITICDGFDDTPQNRYVERKVKIAPYAPVLNEAPLPF